MTAPTELILIDGHSRLILERDVDGRFRLVVHDRDTPGFGVTFGPASADEIAAFLASGSTDRPGGPSRLEARLP